MLFILQVTINSKIKLRVDVCEQAPELLKLLVVAHLGGSPTRGEGGPLGSCRPGPSPTSSRAWSRRFDPSQLGCSPSGCGERGRAGRLRSSGSDLGMCQERAWPESQIS